MVECVNMNDLYINKRYANGSFLQLTLRCRYASVVYVMVYDHATYVQFRYSWLIRLGRNEIFAQILLGVLGKMKMAKVAEVSGLV